MDEPFLLALRERFEHLPLQAATQVLLASISSPAAISELELAMPPILHRRRTVTNPYDEMS